MTSSPELSTGQGTTPIVTVTPVRGGLLHQVSCSHCGHVATRVAVEDAQAKADRHLDDHRRGKAGVARVIENQAPTRAKALEIEDNRRSDAGFGPDAAPGTTPTRPEQCV